MDITAFRFPHLASMKSTKLMATCPRVFKGTLVRPKIRQIIPSQRTANNYKNHLGNYNFMREKVPFCNLFATYNALIYGNLFQKITPYSGDVFAK